MRSKHVALQTIALLLFILPVQAGVTRIEIISRADLLNGKEFGLADRYEKIIAKVYFAVDPSNAHNKIIVDLDKAPRNEQGQVEFSADLYILRPKDLNRGAAPRVQIRTERQGDGAVLQSRSRLDRSND